MNARFGSVARVDRVRRNHALEHAAITVVTEHYPKVFLRGRSNSKGFWVFGEVQTEVLRAAISEALQRLHGGETELAIHPRCGTNLAVAGVMSGVAAALAMQLKPRQSRMSYAILASLGSLLLAPRVGTEAQRHVTTLAELADLRVESIERRRFLREPAHWVRTRSY